MKKNIKNEYKRLLASVLAASAIISMTGCTKKSNEDTKVEEPKTSITEQTQDYIYYQIMNGDTLYDISYTFYGSYDYVDVIAEFNNIKNPDMIVAGRVIKLPNVPEIPMKYTVEFGDSFYDICTRYYKRNDHEIIDKLAKYNNIEKPGEIQAGITILIPDIEVLNEIELDYSFKLK